MRASLTQNSWVLDKPTIIKLFLTHGADPNASIRRASNTIFVQACASTPLSVIQLLVEYGAEASPLALRAASVNQNRRDQMEIVRYILAQGVDINDIPTGECLWPRLGQGTALWHVAREGTAEAIKVLLELGADASIRSSTGTTPLEIARQFQKQDIVTILAHAGVAPATDPENLQQSTQVENEHAAPEKVRPKIHVHVAQSPSGSS